MRILPCGDTGLLLECADLDEVGRLHAALSATTPEGVLDLVSAARTVLVALDPAVTSPDRAREAIASLPAPEVAGGDPGQERVPLQIPVRYDGADLDDVAHQLSCDPGEVVRRHTATTWRVAFCGFAPGFGYLVAEDAADQAESGQQEWSVARRQTPRTVVPPGSVGLAGEFTGVYPRASPGGWQLIGRTEVALFELDRDPPALLVPDTRVRFVVDR